MVCGGCGAVVGMVCGALGLWWVGASDLKSWFQILGLHLPQKVSQNLKKTLDLAYPY